MYLYSTVTCGYLRLKEEDSDINPDAVELVQTIVTCWQVYCQSSRATQHLCDV